MCLEATIVGKTAVVLGNTAPDGCIKPQNINFKADQSFKLTPPKKWTSDPCQSLLIKKTTGPNAIKGKLKSLVSILLGISNCQLKQ